MSILLNREKTVNIVLSKSKKVRDDFQIYLNNENVDMA